MLSLAGQALKGLFSTRTFLIRAVLGKRVRGILETHFGNVRFFAPDSAFAEAREHLPEILLRRSISPKLALTVLDELSGIIVCVDKDIYGSFENATRRRLRMRDEEDWPVLATALALEYPIWTEDADFFWDGYRDLDYGPRGDAA